MDLAASLGLPLLLGVHADDAEVTTLVRRWSEVAGRDCADHARVVLAYPHDRRAPAERELRQLLPPWLAGIQAAIRVLPGAPRDISAHVEHLLRAQPIGPEVAAALAHSAETTGVLRYLCMVEVAGSPAATAELMQALARTS